MRSVIIITLLSFSLTGCGGVSKYFKGSLLVFEAGQGNGEHRSEYIQACRIKARSTTELNDCVKNTGV